MKDIDFDELDRAVSSVLGNNAAQVPPSPPKETVSTGGEATTSHDDVSSDAPSVSIKKQVVQKRPSGRVMDIVHPSSASRHQHAKSPVSRHEATLSPLSTSHEHQLHNPSEQHSSEMTTPVATTTDTAHEHEAVTTTHSESHAFPDPLDFHTAHDDRAKKSDEEPSVEIKKAAISHEETHDFPEDVYGHEDDDMHDDATVALEQAASELSGLNGLIEDTRDVPPLDTPFMNDLAVEKRPLGAFSVGDTDSSLLSDDAKDHMTATEEHMSDIDTAAPNSAKDSEIQHAIARELTSHVESVDGEESRDSEEVQVAHEAQEVAHEETIPEELRQDIVAIESREVTTAPVPDPPKKPVMTSIPQQYAKKQSVQSEEVTPVFDTTDYHQPIKRTDVKKSGWLHIVLIILLVLIGAGGGAAVYFLDLFNLF